MGKVVKLIDSPNDPVRLAFVHVFRKRPGMKNADGTVSKDKFELTAIIKPGGQNEANVKAAIAEVAKESFGDNWATMMKEEFSDDQRGLRKGDLKKTKDGVILDGFEGNVYVVARSDKRPTVVDRDRSVLTEEDGKPYAGAYGTVHIDVWALKRKPGIKPRIVTDLTGVQFTRDGDAFGAGAPPSAPDDFADLSAGDEGGDAGSPVGGSEDPFA